MPPTSTWTNHLKLFFILAVIVDFQSSRLIVYGCCWDLNHWPPGHAHDKLEHRTTVSLELISPFIIVGLTEYTGLDFFKKKIWVLLKIAYKQFRLTKISSDDLLKSQKDQVSCPPCTRYSGSKGQKVCSLLEVNNS